MAENADFTLPEIYESYPEIAPAKFAGKLSGKIVRRILPYIQPAPYEANQLAKSR